MATPAFVTKTSQNIASGKTISITVNSGEVLYAFISKGGNDTPTATWNGGAMTSVAQNNTQGRHQTLFCLPTPTTGTHNVVFSTTQAAGTIVAFTISGANSTPTGQINATQNGSSSPLTGSVTLTYTNSMVVVCSFVDNTPTLTLGSGQTLIYTNTDPDGQTGTASYKIPGVSGVVTMSYTFAGTNDWEPIIFEVVAASPTTGANGNFLAFM